MEEDRKNLMSHVTVLLSQYHELLTQTIDDKEHFHEEEKVFYEVSKVIYPKYVLQKLTGSCYAYFDPKKCTFKAKLQCSHFYVKGKSPEVPFHRNTSSYSYFEYLRPFKKKQIMFKKNYQLNRNGKSVDKGRQCFAFLHIKLYKFDSLKRS